LLQVFPKSGLENVRREVIHLVPFVGDVRGAASFAEASIMLTVPHSASLRVTFPSCWPPSRVMCSNPSSVPAQIKILLGRGFRHGKNRVVNFNAGYLLSLSDRRRLAASACRCASVRADDVPAHARIGGLEQHFSREIEGLRIMRRKHNRFRPLKAVLHIRSRQADLITGHGSQIAFPPGAVIVAC